LWRQARAMRWPPTAREWGAPSATRNRRMGRGPCSPVLRLAPIHRSAWKADSRKSASKNLHNPGPIAPASSGQRPGQREGIRHLVTRSDGYAASRFIADSSPLGRVGAGREPPTWSRHLGSHPWPRPRPGTPGLSGRGSAASTPCPEQSPVRHKNAYNNVWGFDPMSRIKRGQGGYSEAERCGTIRRAKDA
jgi:hypothetical protein